jgi:hypothetical protein
MGEIFDALRALLPWHYVPRKQEQETHSGLLILGSDSRASKPENEQAESEWRAV